MSEWTIDVNEANFETEVLDRSNQVPVVIDFWAPWCGPCRAMAPQFEQAAHELRGRALLIKVNSDDNAFWQRAKTISMNTEFITMEGHRLGYAQVLAKEADGILNWLIEGMEQYRLYGLAEPESVRRDIEAYRVDVDMVACFVRDRIEDGALIPQLGAQIKSSILRGMFEAYCTENHQIPLGMRRYQNRLVFSIQAAGSATTPAAFSYRVFSARARS